MFSQFSNAYQPRRGKYQIYCRHNRSTPGKTSTLGIEIFANRNLLNFQLIHQNSWETL